MKKFRRYIHTLCFTAVLAGCSSESKDVSVKKDLAAKVKAEIDFVGVRFVVHEGIVTLNGVCATQSAYDAVHNKVKNLYGVKDVMNNIKIADVVIGKDWLLRRGVDSILTEYPQVEGITKDSTVTLRGTVEASKKEELLLKMKGLMPRQLEVQLTEGDTGQGN